ncbi:MAG: hypothetical protein ACI8T1_000329 [Verrucomicrobiales bacterium]|jgi:hypothetical protein
MLNLLKSSPSAAAQREAYLAQEAEDVEMELSILEKFLTAAPMLQEEARYLLPPPEEMTVPAYEAPNRTDIKRVQRMSYYYGIKLVALLSIFLTGSVWFVDRLLNVMR